MTNKNHPTTQPLAYGIKDACTAIGIGRSTLYQEISEGRLRTFKVRSRTLIAATDLEAWLDGYKCHAA